MMHHPRGSARRFIIARKDLSSRTRAAAESKGAAARTRNGGRAGAASAAAIVRRPLHGCRRTGVQWAGRRGPLPASRRAAQGAGAEAPLTSTGGRATSPTSPRRPALPTESGRWLRFRGFCGRFSSPLRSCFCSSGVAGIAGRPAGARRGGETPGTPSTRRVEKGGRGVSPSFQLYIL